MEMLKTELEGQVMTMTMLMMEKKKKKKNWNGKIMTLKFHLYTAYFHIYIILYSLPCSVVFNFTYKLVHLFCTHSLIHLLYFFVFISFIIIMIIPVILLQKK